MLETFRADIPAGVGEFTWDSTLSSAGAPSLARATAGPACTGHGSRGGRAPRHPARPVPRGPAPRISAPETAPGLEAAREARSSPLLRGRRAWLQASVEKQPTAHWSSSLAPRPLPRYRCSLSTLILDSGERGPSQRLLASVGFELDPASHATRRIAHEARTARAQRAHTDTENRTCHTRVRSAQNT